MKHYPHPSFAKEGWPFIAISVGLALLILWLTNLIAALPFILIAAFVVQFFRDPPRTIPEDANVILSPADGKIICIEQAHDVYQDVQALKISVFMNVFNVHSNRAPADGEVLDVQYFAGKFVNADFDKASTENERNAVILRMSNGQRITFVQVAGLIARRILCYTKPGEWLKRGERYGFIRFGSRVDVYLPLNATPLVSIGQKVKATETILARID
ncbi:MAG: phosphatidylserine decarboxylase [Burkholderiales bacterium]|nr:phosphatidylserine decarboxylase [Burkholderiales bacterium]MBP9767985.1 phosphatidylserine decarboxylase [Burkholderiales bacterium]MBX9866667.1 phosphatidylserine decarboxylase [Burkholderiales bacterium]HCY39499.1 phosphatidylserine decarboxylase family protein [Neisseriales bacterium]